MLGEGLNDNLCENIDAILYINLEHRKDRNEHIINEIKKIDPNLKKTHRIDAVYNERGAIGCGLSHIKALEFALTHPEWNSILILEDDFTFKTNNTDEIISKIEQLFNYSNYNNGYDMLLLSHNNLKYSDTINQNIKKVLYSQTTSSYIINRAYINTLRLNLKESTTNMINFGVSHQYSIDIYWTKLQPNGSWYAIYPSIGYQYANYSDIEKRECNYGC
jgi:glycosyl transferase family 25